MMSWDAIISVLQNFGTATLIVLSALYAIAKSAPVLWSHYVRQCANAHRIAESESMARIELYRTESDQRQRLLGMQIDAAERQAGNVLTAMGTLNGMQEELTAMREELSAMREELVKLREIYVRNFDVVERMERIVADLVDSLLTTKG